MKRETAKKLIETFNDEELKELEYLVDRSIIEHYANGGNLCDPQTGIVYHNPSFRYNHVRYGMIKPTYTLLGIEIEGEPPLSELPEINKDVYVLDPRSITGVVRIFYNGDPSVIHAFRRGLIFATEEAAITAAKTLGWYKNIIQEPAQGGGNG